MAMSMSEVRAVAAELDERLRAARVRKIHEPANHEIVVTLGSGSTGTMRLLIGTHRQHPRLHLLDAGRTNPPTPSPFCMTLRRHLDGARLDHIEATPGDRIVRFTLARGGATTFLVAELFPGRGAVLLLDADDRVLATRSVSLSGGREAIVGERYAAPSARPSSDEPEPIEAPGCESRVALREEAAERASELEVVRARAESAVRRERRRTERLVEKLEAAESARQDPELCRTYGEALKASLGSIPRGAESVRLTAWTAEGETEVDVPLDPKRGPKENMERWFKRARKAERAADHIARSLEKARARVAELEAREAEAAAAASVDDLPPEARETRRKGAKRRDEVRTGPPRYLSRDGYTIVVGRTAAENDEVTFRVAKGRDLWMHVRGRPGSHVVIRVPDLTRPPPLETLLDAAILAVHNSRARGSTKVEVSYTQRKNVRKPRGASPGSVTMSGEKTLLVDPDDARLRRLTDTRE